MNEDRKLAEAHVFWFMGRIRELVGAMLDVFEPLLVDHMEHGIKHGREIVEEEKKKGQPDTTPD